eukprot:gene4581-9106_t
MDFLRRIEDDVKNLAAEVKKKYPDVRDATDRALITLKTMRESYVAEIMRGGGGDTPKIAKYRSADVSAPYILACNYVDASLKTVMLSLNGLQMLLNYEVVPPTEAKNILKALSTQAVSGRAEVQLKVLQIVLQLANSLSAETLSSEYLTETNVCGMMHLGLQLCDGNKFNVSVSSTAFATVRQMMALVMDGAITASTPFTSHTSTSSNNSGSGITVDVNTHSNTVTGTVTGTGTGTGTGISSSAAATTSASAMTTHNTASSSTSSLSHHPSSTSTTTPSSLPQCALYLVQELALFLRSLPGDWMRGVVVSPGIALDLLHDVISNWKHLFQQFDKFKSLLKNPVVYNLKPLLKSLREDYITAMRMGLSNPGAMTSRVVRLARCLLLNFLDSEFALEAEAIVSLMVHTLQPERGVDFSPLSKGHVNEFGDGMNKIIRGGEEGAMAVAMGMGIAHSSLLSRLGSATAKLPSPAMNANPRHGVAGGNFLLLGGSQNYPGGGGGNGGTSSAPLVPAHPAGVCLEAILSLLLSDRFMERMVGAHGEGEGALVVAMTSISVTVAALLAEGSVIDGNMRDFETTLRGSLLVTMVEGVLIGAETDTEGVGRSLHEYIITCGAVTSAEVLVLAFQVSQVIARVLVRCSLQCQSQSKGKAATPRMADKNSAAMGSIFGRNLFISTGVLESFIPHDNPAQSGPLRRAGSAICDRVFEGQLEACTALLQRTEEAGAIRRCLGILSEGDESNNYHISPRTTYCSHWALATGLLGLQRPSDVIIATLCRFTVPKWHGQDHSNAPAPSTSLSAPVELFRWRHVQAVVRLLQVVHVLSDVITDWDAVMDCFEQLVSFIASPKSQFHEDVTALELEKIAAAVERFKLYSIFLSDEALVRVMASLVAFMMQSTPLGGGGGGGGMLMSKPSPLAMSSQNSSISSSNMNISSYQVQTDGSGGGGGSNSNTASFSLLAAVEVTRFNAYRVACVWQLMTSHLRMVAAHKMSSVRLLAVAATHDVIAKTLEYMRHPVMPPEGLVFLEDEILTSGIIGSINIGNGNSLSADGTSNGNGIGIGQTSASSSPASSTSLFLSDALLFNGGVFQCFETVFSPRVYQRNILLASVINEQPRPELGQEDLLGSLKAIVIIRHLDVRADIIQGLLSLLQGVGQAVSGGWSVVIELLTSVAASMTIPSSVVNEGGGGSMVDEGGSGGGGSGSGSYPMEEDPEEASRAGSWPKSSLLVAFSCMTLIVDDFLEALPVHVIRDVIHALSVFSAQTQDVNISLTSVEMLWKVSDFIMTISKERGDESTTSSVLQFTMSRLLLLSTDTRPEIRNCATNTLFSAMAANAQLLTPNQWQMTFDEVVFPLFTRSEELSNIAMKSNEEAIAPELKKGVKMTVHHSRDTAHKQWSETRVLALRGVARLFRACSRLLLGESWFKDTWQAALGVCVRSIHAANGESEVSLAGVDALFAMLKTVAAQSYKGMRVVGGALVEDVPAEQISSTSTTSSTLISSSSSGSGRKIQQHHHPVTTTAHEKDITHGKHNKAMDTSTSSSTSTSSAVDESMDMWATEAGAREALWQLSWTAVRLSVCFDEPTGSGGELALHLCQQLRDLFAGGLEGEFRYSENVKNLLEMVVILARPRAGIPGGGGVTKDKMQSRNAITGEVQLQRGVMTLLKDVRPTDPVSWCCTISALAELCYAVQPAMIQQQLSQSQSQPIDTRPPPSPPIVHLSAVDDRLRAEAGDYLISMLEGTATTPTPTTTPSTSITADTTPPPKIKGAFNMSVLLEVTCARFVSDLCDGLMDARRQKTDTHIASSPSAMEDIHAVTTAAAASSASGTVGGFLTSIGKMLSTSNINSPPHKSKTDQMSSSSFHKVVVKRKAASIMGMTLHRLDRPLVTYKHTTTGKSDNSPSKTTRVPVPVDPWSSFPVPNSALRLLSAALNTCLPNIGSAVSEQVWCHTLLLFLCCMSPWQQSELVTSGLLPPPPSASKEGSGGGGGSAIAVSVRAISRTANDSFDTQPISTALSAIVSHYQTYRTKTSVIVMFIEVLEIVSRLSVFALGEIAIAGRQESSLPPTPPDFARSSSYPQPPQNTCVDAVFLCRLQLEAFALLAILVVSRDLMNLLLVTRSEVFAPGGPSSQILTSIRTSASEYLRLLTRMRTTLDLLPSYETFDPHGTTSTTSFTSSTSSLVVVIELMDQWHRVVNEISALSSEDNIHSQSQSQSQSQGTGSGTGTGSGSGSKRSEGPSELATGTGMGMGMGMGMMEGTGGGNGMDGSGSAGNSTRHRSSSVDSGGVDPLVDLQILACIGAVDDGSGTLRQAALELISTIDFRVLTSSYSDTITALQSANDDKAELEEELLTVRSAASLPF